MSTIIISASGKIRFDSFYFGKSISDWITIVNKSISKENNFQTIRITPGKFGYDVMATMIFNVFQCVLENKQDIMLYIRNNLDITPYMNVIHGGFVETYLYWKNFDPVSNSGYTAPTKPIINEYNNNYATTYFEKLLPNIQDMYVEIFNILMNIISDNVLTEGLKNMNLVK